VLPQKVEDEVGQGQQSFVVGVPCGPACRQLLLLFIIQFQCNTSTVAHMCEDLYRMQPHEVAHGHLVVVQSPHEGPQRAQAPAVGLNLGVSFNVAQPPPHRRAIDPGLHLV
jgi:hypothetical protein